MKCKICDFVPPKEWLTSERRIMIALFDHLFDCHRLKYDEYEKRCYSIALDYLEEES